MFYHRSIRSILFVVQINLWHEERDQVEIVLVLKLRTIRHALYFAHRNGAT